MGIDNPVMAGAFAGFMGWAWDQEEMHKAFCEATGQTPLSPASDRLAVLIDEATGLTEAYTVAFIEWLIVNHWGEDEGLSGRPLGAEDETADFKPVTNPK